MAWSMMTVGGVTIALVEGTRPWAVGFTLALASRGGGRSRNATTANARGALVVPVVVFNGSSRVNIAAVAVFVPHDGKQILGTADQMNRAR